MFEDILQDKDMNIAMLSQASGVGYNYVFKIVKNQTDFERCGIGTAKKIADALKMSLDNIYEYKNNYFQKKIYYQDQSGWDYQKYGDLNAELNKLLLICIDYRFSCNHLSRSKKSSKIFDIEASCIKYDMLSDVTKCIMIAILNQQKKLNEFVEIYKNLELLTKQKPLKEKVYLTNNPYNIFPSYKAMNLIY